MTDHKGDCAIHGEPPANPCDCGASKLEEIWARADAATGGPWEDALIGTAIKGDHKRAAFGFREDVEHVICEMEPDEDNDAQQSMDMDFIIHARGDIPYLRTVIADQANEIERLETMVENLGGQVGD